MDTWIKLFKVRVFFAVVCSTLCIATTFAADAPPNSKVAFIDEFTQELQAVDVASGKVTYLHVGRPLAASGLAYSKPKRVMAIEESGPGNFSPSIYLFWRTTKKLIRVYKAKSDKSILFRPVFDPAGQYVYALNHTKGIARYPLAGGKWESVKVVGKDGVAPQKLQELQKLAFSRSGARVALSPSMHKGFLIATVTANGLHVDQEILSDFRYCTNPQWVGDSAIIFAGHKQPGISSLWRYDLSSGALEQLTTTVAVRDFISLSDDEKAVVFTASNITGQETEWHLWLLKLDGSEPVQITKNRTLYGEDASDLYPVWLD